MKPFKKFRKKPSNSQATSEPVVDPTKPDDNVLVSYSDFAHSVNDLMKIFFPQTTSSASLQTLQPLGGMTFEELGLIVAYIKNHFFPATSWEEFMDTVAFPEKHLPELEKYFCQPQEVPIEEQKDESLLLSWDEFMTIIAFPENFFMESNVTEKKQVKEQGGVTEDPKTEKGRTRMKVMKNFFRNRQERLVQSR